MEVRVVGIDASLRGTGVCALINGTFRLQFLPDKNRRGAERLLYLRDKLFKFIDKAKPVLALLEGYSYNSEGRLFEIGEWGGVIKVGLFERKIRILTVPPYRLKKFVGVKKADGKRYPEDTYKTLIVDAVKRRYKLDTKQNDNLADAAILAKIGEVYLTGSSTYRSELEVVRDLKTTKDLKGAGSGWKFRKLRGSL